MAAIGTFPTIRNVIDDGENIKSYTVGGTLAVKAGMILAYNLTGVAKTVQASVKGTTGAVVGVALYDAAVGAQVAVAGRGCRVYVANTDDTTAIGAGVPIEPTTNAIGGCGAALALAGSLAMRYCAGFAVDIIAGNGTGIMEVAPHIVIDAAS